MSSQPRLWRRAWDGWLRVAHLIGTVQMVVILTIVYWLFLTLAVLPFGIIADPLKIRRSLRGTGWRTRRYADDALHLMRRQG